MTSIFVDDREVMTLMCKWRKSPQPIGLGISLPKAKTLKCDIVFKNNDLSPDKDNTYNETVVKMSEFLSKFPPTDTIGIGAWSSQYPLWYPENVHRIIKMTRDICGCNEPRPSL
jgi:hypothetical protein